jgi:hypothetical protein
VFTARYALSPYIKQTRFAFKGSNELLNIQDSFLKCFKVFIRSPDDDVNSAVRHPDNRMFNKLLNNQASVLVFLSVLFVGLEMV